MRVRILIAILVVAGIVGCGGGGEESSQPATASESAATRPLTPALVSRAEAICEQLVSDAQRMGAAFRNRSDFGSNPLELTTRALFKPAIPVVEANAERLRKLTAETANSDFQGFVRLYDPILALLHERVEAGEAGDPQRARELEFQIVELATLQQRLAHSAGLNSCGVDFIETFSTPGSG